MAECPVNEMSLKSIQQCPQCKNVLNEPMKLTCLHSYCKTCLEKLPKTEQDGRSGWRCKSCDWFTGEDDIREDKLLERLITMEQDKQSGKKQYETCQFCNKAKEVLFCHDCIMSICQECKDVHDKIPATKHHHIKRLEDATKGIIDEVQYCTKHEKLIIDTYCISCNEMVCRQCFPNHKKHDFQITEERLQELNTSLDKYNQKITSKLEIAKKQVEDLNKEIQSVQEKYAKWRIDSDVKLEMLINKLKATKAAIDETVNDEESRNLERLKEIKSQIENQVERLNIALRLSKVTNEKTRNITQLMQLESGLHKHMEGLSNSEIIVEYFDQTTPYIKEELYVYTEDELKQILRPVSYENTNKVVHQCGRVLKQLEYMCEDLNKYLKQQFENSETIQISDEWCNRVNVIEQYLYIGHGGDNFIQQYNTEGTCVQTFHNLHETIVVKQANNGDIIAAGLDGIYVTNRDFSEWRLLQKGWFSDIAIHGNKITALEIIRCQVVTFVWSYGKGQYEWRLQNSFDIEEEYRGNWEGSGNETLTVDNANNVIICIATNKLLVYSSNGEYVKSTILVEESQMIIGTDSKGSVLLCEFHSGKMYCINNLLQMDTNNMDQYYVAQKDKLMRDMTIDCDANLWILHGNNPNVPFHLTKYLPSR